MVRLIMNIQQHVDQLKSKFDILAVVNLNEWTEEFILSRNWLEHTCKQLHQDSYQGHQRIVFLHQQDFYNENINGIILENLQNILNFVDISNYFVNITKEDKHYPKNSENSNANAFLLCEKY